jgi:hypothetical protein
MGAGCEAQFLEGQASHVCLETALLDGADLMRAAPDLGRCRTDGEWRALRMARVISQAVWYVVPPAAAPKIV